MLKFEINCFVFDSAGLSKKAPKRDYSLEPSDSGRVFSAFTSISIIAAIFGNGILPEIQVKYVGKSFKHYMLL